MRQTSSRRTFMLQVITATSAVAATSSMAADEAPAPAVRLTEDDPFARSMGFRLDTNKADQAKYPRHNAATQHCSKCQFYFGKPDDAIGPCAFFGGRLVPVGGWCQNFMVRQPQ